MGNMTFNFSELDRFRDRLQQVQVDEFFESCAKELAARLLRKAIKRTPVGQYDNPVNFTTEDGTEVSFTPHSGKQGGTLRRGWTAVNQIEVEKIESSYRVVITNPTYYAEYVEFGHRTANHEGWINGKFMLTYSEQELRAQAPAILERKLNDFLKETFNG